MNKKVMICDDDEGILEMLEMVLGSEDISVSTEANSLKIFERLREERPDLLILDLWMPVLTGDQIAKKLRSLPEFEQMPILIISASRDGEDIARNAGASAYLAKPFDIDKLIQKVDSLTEQRLTA